MCGGTPWDGLFVKDADPKIIETLEAEGKLYDAPEFEHSYPFCWRCDTPLFVLCAQHLVHQDERGARSACEKYQVRQLAAGKHPRRPYGQLCGKRHRLGIVLPRTVLGYAAAGLDL